MSLPQVLFRRPRAPSRLSSRMYSYNRIHNDYDNNVVRVELNSSYRPRTSQRAPSREPMRVVTPSVNRNDTFTKHDRPSNIIRSDTFILKHHDESSDERPDYSTYSRSKKNGHDEKRNGDKSNYSTYTRRGKKGNEFRAKCHLIKLLTFGPCLTIFRQRHREVSVHQHRHVSETGAQEAIERKSGVGESQHQHFHQVEQAEARREFD